MRLNDFTYWAGVIAITACASFAITECAAADDACKWELDNAKSVCRALGRKSPECGAAIDDYKLCLTEAADYDPIGGLSEGKCVTICRDMYGRQVCTTTCTGPA